MPPKRTIVRLVPTGICQIAPGPVPAERPGTALLDMETSHPLARSARWSLAGKASEYETPPVRPVLWLRPLPVIELSPNALILIVSAMANSVAA